VITKWTRIEFFTTPEELRSIADEMEQKWPKMKLGDRTCVHTIFDSKMLVQLEFMVDQDRVNRHA
jgi:hypothetical protein